MERSIIILSVLLVTANAGPIQLSVNGQSKTCSRTCTGSNKFNYAEGRTYSYRYESDLKTLIKGASEDMASLHLSANVQMEVLSKCELSMKLSDVTLTEYDPADAVMKEVSSEFKTGLEKFPVRVSFQDGGIEDICLSGAEPTWVLNAKRGIISLFQNNMADLSRNHTVTETDVSGVCNTEYFARESGYYTTSIGKTKNLLGCTDRHGYNTAIQGVPYKAQSDIQSLPLLKSDHNCVHNIDKRSGLLKSVQCEEHHVFRPFSKSDSGAVTINTQSLTYVGETTGTRSPAPIKTRVSLKFDHVHVIEGEGKNRKDITRKLMEICERTKAGVRPETPKLFTDLVYLMKSADIDTLSDINKMLKENKLCSDNLFRTRKFFLDALPMTGTSASLHMITQLITSKEITGLEADMWLTTLSFIKNPTKDMLKEVKPLINAPAISEKAMLSVGILVHSYCFHHGNCENDNMVKAIMSAFVNKMAKGCKVKDNNLKTTLMALRGIGNAGYATNAIKQLSLCMKLRSNPIEIRLSAIEAFRRMPCDSDRVGLMNILEDTEEDSEIRIAAYKVLMECPSNKVLGVVRNTLAREEVNQVGSYIWTHLTNLMETSDRHKQDIRALLEDETFKKEFDLDKRKFSRNYEGSAFIERINTGAKIEGDLIWSSKSFIPRSGMMNLTFDLFGHSVNLFEIGGRAEGLEYFMESFFGPNGYFRNPEAADSNTKDIVPKNIRADKLKKIDKRFSAQMDDLRGSLYMRVFGNELRYMNFKGMDSLLSAPDFNILDMLIKLSEDNDYTFTHSSMFMDSTYIVPTSSGFPLNLTVNGTATVDLKMKGKMDLRHPPTLNIAGRIQPSAAIDISSMMSVDAFVTKSGVKMVSTLHTNTALEGKISIDKKGSITSEYVMPEPRMEIIDVKSSFFTVHRDSEREQKMIEENRQTFSKCSSEKVVTITGLELCAEVEYPNASLKADAPYFPLTGPVSAGVYLYNRDTHVKYILEAKSIHNKDKNIVHFTFDTPNSRINRHIAVDLSLNKADHTVAAALTSPWKKANFEGSVVNTKKESSISGKMKIDESLQYSLDAKLAKDVSGNSYIYTPSLEIRSNKKIITSSTGMLTLKKNLKQCDVEFNINGLATGPFSTQFSFNNKEALMGIQGSIGITQSKQYSFNVHLATTNYKKKVLYKPLVSLRTPDTEVMALGGGVTHILGKGLDINLILDKVVAKKITLKGKMNKAVKRRRSIYNTKLDFTSGPADFALKAKFDKRAAGTLASDIDFTYVIRRVARNNLKLVSKITNQSSKTLTKAKAAINFEVKRNPELNMKVLSDISHNKKHTEFAGDIWYGPNFKDESKHIDMRFEMNRVLKSIMNASADIQTRIRVPALNFITMVKGSHRHTEKNLDTNLMFKFGKSQPIETSLKINDNTNKLMKVDAEYKLTIPGYNIDIEHSLEQKIDNRYVSSLKTQMKKGQKNEINTTILPDSRKLALTSDIKLFGKSPAKMTGEFGLEPTDFIMSLSFEKDLKKYAGSLTSVTEIGKSSWLTLDIYHPSRHMVLSMTGKNENDLIFGDAEIQLNTNQKITMKSWFEKPTSDKLNGSITVISPTRTVILNAHLTKGSKYLSHVDFQWDSAKKITADTDFNVKDRSIIGSAKITTPFMALPKLAIETQLSHDSEQYNVGAKLTLDKSHTISLKSELKKPISLKTLIGSLIVKSSKVVYGLKSISFNINHKLSNSLASDVRFGWNKQFIQTTIILQNKTKGFKVAYDGSLDLKTSYLYMKKGKVNLSHDNNGRNFNTVLSFNRNKRAYKIVSAITHQPSQDRYDNAGTVKIFSPYGNAESTWNHRHTKENFATTFESAWGKNKNKAITGRFSGRFDDSFDAKFELQTPFANLRQTSFEFSHSHENGHLDSKLYLSANGIKLGSAELGYLVEEDKYNTGLTIAIPKLNVDTQIKASVNLQRNGKVTAFINASIMPKISMSIEASQQNSDSGALTHTLLLWKSSFRDYEQVRYSYEVLADDHLSTITTLQYNKDKQIKLETKFAFERNEKFLNVVLSTPFQSLPKLQGGISISGDLDSFHTNAYIDAHPLLARTAAKFSWKTKSGLNSNLRIDLPIANYPYFQADASGIFGSDSSEGQLKIEYMPREVIVIEGSHTISESEITLNGKAATPYGTFAVQHSSKPNEFTSKLSLEDSKMVDFSATVGLTNNDKISGTATLSIAGKRDISAVFTHSGDISRFNTHAEVQHNRKNNFVSDLSFSAHDNLKLSFAGSLRAQAISDTEEFEAAFDFNGVPLKFNTHGEFATTSLGKSQTDISFDVKTAVEGSLVLKSPLMKNVKASFNHFRRNDYIQSNVDIIHGGKKVIDIQSNVNSLDSLIFEFKCKTPVLQDITFMTRFDGDVKSFVIRSEGTYGLSKADADLTSKVDVKMLQQKISLSATGMPDISAELNHNGDLSQLKTYGELNIGPEKHRIDVAFNRHEKIEGSFSLDSPLFVPYGANFQLSGSNIDFTSHTELTIGDNTSSADVIFALPSVERAVLEASFKSPYLRDISIKLSNLGKGETYNFKCHLSMEGVEDLDLELTSTKQPYTSTMISLKTPFENLLSFKTSFTIRELKRSNRKFHFDYALNDKSSEVDVTYSQIKGHSGQLSIKSHLIPDSSVSFEYEGSLNNIKGRADYNFGGKKSEIDIFFSGLSRKEGLLTIESHLIPDISVGFEHDGTLKKFKSHGEFSIGIEKREFDISVNVEDDIAINMQYKCPVHGLSTASFTHQGILEDFKCHAEIKRGSDLWEGDVSFSSNKKIHGLLKLRSTDSTRFEPLTLSFGQSGTATNFQSNFEIILGNDKTTNELSWMLSEHLISTNLKIASPYMRDLSANFKLEGQPKNIKLHADFICGSDRMNSDFTFEITQSSVSSSISLISSIYSDITGSFIVQGKLNDFSSDIYMKIDNQESTGHFNFKHDIDIESVFELKSAYMDNIRMDLQHSGDISKFTTSYITTIAGKQNKASMKVDMIDGMHGELSLDKPAIYMKGTFEKGIINTILKKGSDEFSVNLSYLLEEAAVINCKITTPFNGYKTFMASYEHSGTIRNFKCTGKLEIEHTQNDFNLKMDTAELTNLACSLDITSPYVLPISLKLRNAANSGEYFSDFEFHRNNQKAIGLSASFIHNKRKNENNCSISFTLNDVEHKILEMSSSSFGFDITSEIYFENKSNKVEVTFTQRPKLVATFTFDSKQFPTIQANIDFDGTPSNFAGSCDLNIDGRKSGHITVSLNTVDKIATTFSMELPFTKYRDLNGVFSFIPGDDAFTIEAKMTNELLKLFEVNMNFKINNIDFVLESNTPHPLSARAIYSNFNQNIKVSWELIHASKNLLNGNIDVTMKFKPIYITGLAAIKTQSGETTSKIHIDPTTNNFMVEASAERNSDTWTVLGRLDASKDVDAEFSLTIPNMDDIKGTLVHTKRTYRSKTNAELRFNATHYIGYDMEWKWRNGFDGIFSLRTPIQGFENINLKTEHEGSFPSVKSSAELQIAEKVISASATFSQKESRKAEFTLSTPFKPFENLELSMYHDGVMSNFRTGGRLMYVTGEDIELDIDHMWIGTRQHLKTRFMSPYTDEIMISANHSGNVADFSSAYEIALGKDVNIISKTYMKSGKNFLSFSNEISSEMSGESYIQKIELKHDGNIENFKTEALVQSQNNIYRFGTTFHLDPVIEGSIELITPLENFRDMKVSFTHSGSANSILTTGDVQYAPTKKISGKIDMMQYGLKRMVANIELMTPFENMKVNKLSYTHSSDSDSIHCEIDSLFYGKEIAGTLDASKTPLDINLDIKTPFTGFETIGLNGQFLSKRKNYYKSKLQAKWNPTHQIDIEGSISPKNGEISITSPFRHIRDASIKISEKQLTRGFLESVKIIHNGNSIVDFEIDHSLSLKNKHIHINTRAPKSMKFEIDGEFSLAMTDFDLEANWNTEDINSRFGAEISYDIRSQKTVNVKVTQSKLPGKSLTLSALINDRHSKADLSWGMKPDNKVGYEVTVGDYDGTFKLILPSRSFVLSGSHRGQTTEGSFMWDADVDQTKKVAIQSRTVTASDIAKASIVIMMPSLGKNVQVGSEISVNQGRVIFDGKTVLSYSGDSRKKLVFTSKLEDISIGRSQNYSLSFGVSHPYTTLGVRVNTHAGRSKSAYTAGVGLEYLTVKEQTKRFHMGAKIDKLMKAVSFELQSPIKSVSISGSVQNDDKFRISLLNIYDQKQPLTTTFTFDPSARAINFVTNYDEDKPRNEFHVNMKYVNSTAISTEVYHIVRRARVTDIMVTAQLNTSHILHSRIHWRPQIKTDLKEFVDRKLNDYHMRLREAAARIEPEIVEEVTEKFRKIWRAVEEEIGEENIAAFEAAVVPYLDLALQNSIALSQPFVQHISVLLMEQRKNTLSQQPVTLPLSSETLDFERLYSLKQKISDNFNFVSEQMKLPAKHFPKYASRLMNDAFNYTTNQMPASVASQMIVLKSYGLIDAMEDVIREEILAIEKEAEAKLRDIEEITMRHMKSPFTVYDPAHGEIQIELYSIIPIQSLDSLPSLDFIKPIEKLNEWKNSISMDRLNGDLSLPDMSGEWMPPFSGVASVSNGHKITTFDGYVYDLTSDCTYILSRDYMDGNFTFVLSNDGYTTLTVLSSGKAISINLQGEILVDGKPATLPFTEGYITVTQGENGVITIKGGNHFTVDYDLTIDHMNIQISGWYHGRTGGLLGIYDNEPSNDKMTPFNKVVEDNGRFAKTWEVGTNSC